MCEENFSLSNELWIDMLLKTLLAQKNDDLSPYKVSFTELLEASIFTVNEMFYPGIIAFRQVTLDNYSNICTILYFSGLTGLLLLAITTCFNMKNVRLEYILSIRTITFLSEEMIKNSERVESFFAEVK